jgi:1,4-dihydroxy-2-naphthoate octaprenyltransferase
MAAELFSMNVLIINGHPRKDSLSEALVNAYAEGALAAGVNLTQLHLYALPFDQNVTHFSPTHQPLEAPLLQAQELITWAHHVVFVYPTWWGTMPALLKGFLDRVLTAGFAFEDIEGGTGYAPLLRGKSAQLITTMDTPLWVYTWIYRAPGHNAMRRAILQFCGFHMARTLSFGPVKSSDQVQRQQWLGQVKKEGHRLQRGALSPWKKFTIKAGSWLKALRLQFYPMTALAYATGASGAALNGYGFESSLFWLGYGWLLLGEIATVFTNEYFDYESDRQNRYFSPFTGGSRVLVDKLLGFREMKTGICLSLGLSLIILSLLLTSLPGSFLPAALTCALIYVLALGYTLPPLRLSYRGLGEIDVGLTHSFAVVLCGYIFQGGKVGDALPWLVGLPLFLAVLPSIILAGIPDYEADKAALKNTLAVRCGKKGAACLALAFTWLAAIVALVFEFIQVLPGVFDYLLWPILPHAGLLTMLLCRYLKTGAAASRIDGLLLASLTYLIWFALIPWLNLG